MYSYYYFRTRVQNTGAHDMQHGDEEERIMYGFHVVALRVRVWLEWNDIFVVGNLFCGKHDLPQLVRTAHKM